MAEAARLEAVSDIPRFLAARQISHIYHFTPLKNLVSISKHGFLGRNTLESLSIEYSISDPSRYEPVLDAICFSISTPNDLMANSKIRSGHEMVLLEIGDVEALLTSLTFISVPGNFGSSSLKSRLQQWPEEFIGGMGLANLFNNEELRNRYQIPVNEPTDPQSELLFLEPVPWNHVKRVLSPGSHGYATQEVVREVLPKLPKGIVFQSQDPGVFKEINWKDDATSQEFFDRSWNETWRL